MGLGRTRRTPDSAAAAVVAVEVHTASDEERNSAVALKEFLERDKE